MQYIELKLKLGGFSFTFRSFDDQSKNCVVCSLPCSQYALGDLPMHDSCINRAYQIATSIQQIENELYKGSEN